MYASCSILSLGFDTILLRFQIKKNDPSVLWPEKSSVFCEEDGFRNCCTDCTYFHPLTAQILCETLIDSTVCIIAIFLATFSLDIMCGWNIFVVWSWREQIGQNSVSDRSHIYIPRIFDRHSEMIPVRNKTYGRGTDFVFSKTPGPAPGPTMVPSDWIGDKAARDGSFPSRLSLVFTHTVRVRRYILPLPRLHSVHKEDITIYKTYAKVKGRICCTAING